jgi:hypothetical protein
MARGTMKVLDASTGLMECRVCGAQHIANLRTGGHYYRGSWQCADRDSHPDGDTEVSPGVEGG